MHALQQGGDRVLPRKQGCGGRGAGLGLCRLQKTRERETPEKPRLLRPGGEAGEGSTPREGLTAQRERPREVAGTAAKVASQSRPASASHLPATEPGLGRLGGCFPVWRSVTPAVLGGGQAGALGVGPRQGQSTGPPEGKMPTFSDPFSVAQS